MTVTVQNIIPVKTMEIASTVQYTSDDAKTVIDKFTVTNIGTVNVSFGTRLNGSSTDTQVIKERTLVPNQTYLCPEMIGQVLEAGQTLRTTCTVADSLNVSAAGRLIT